MTLDLMPLLSDDDLDFISSVLDATITDCSAALRVRDQLYPGRTFEHTLERLRSRAVDIRQRIEAR